MAIFTNQATLTYNNGSAVSNVVTGEILEVLSATKTAVRPTYNADTDVTYVISIVNSGAVDFNGLSVTDDLGGYPFDTTTVYPLNYADGSARYYVNGVLQAAPAVTAGPPLVFNGINVPAGGNAVIVYEADVTQFAPLATGSTIVNNAAVQGAGVTTPIPVSETVTVIDQPELTINKGISPATITENGTLTYTFTVQNSGNAEATADDTIVVTDTFTPILSNLTVTLNGTPLAEGTDYTYDAATGTFATVAGRVTVPAAIYTQNVDGSFVTTPGVSTLVVSGTV